MERILEQLNPVQREAVIYDRGPQMVIAGAGSGKTRVLTYKIAYLISKGVSPRKILALTFTNKAANEMKERIGQLVGQEHARSLWMGTFHSIFARILRSEAALLGYSSSYSIYDTTDSRSVIKSVIKELNLNPDQYKPNEVQSRISRAKNDLITVASYQSNALLLENDRRINMPQMVDIYRLYTIRCKKADAMDFDDLLLNTNILFRDFPEALAKYQHWFEYILVDEYQDTNFAQYYIVKKLAQLHQNICVVGDDAQSIYAFRGARIENILNFKNDYPQHALFKLEENYRSTQVIVNAANSVIAKNKGQIPKQVFSNKEMGEPIKILELNTDHEEGYQVASEIMNISLSQQVPYQRFAVLYRTNAQSRIFEEALRKKNIPYRIYGSMSFYQRKEIKDLLAYLRLIENPKDDEALKRIINYPARGIGDTTLEKIELAASQHTVSMWEVIGQPSAYDLQLAGNTLAKITAFKNLIEEFRTFASTNDAYEVAEEVLRKSGMLSDLKSETSYESISRLENIEELLNSIKDFVEQSKQENGNPSLAEYLGTVSLLSDTEIDDDDDNNKVSLMTIHAAKGLEFDYIFIAGMEEGLFPSSMLLGRDEEIEEERRLFYVALTRAKKRVMISYAKNRYRWGKPVQCSPSRFIFEIDPKYVDYKAQELKTLDNLFNENEEFENNKDARRRPDPVVQSQVRNALLIQKRRLLDINTASQRSASTPNNETATSLQGNLKAGMRVIHHQFGEGTVVSIEGTEPNQKATVHFDTEGEKKLLLKFARLQIIQ
ncbi:MAG TPA: 3'-5' exonuclease [Bacteroidales bacterium]|nr:3'-5' exonuclease [Bacteroidales bacterium]HPO65244.1 3'-5' exonuclease [Bacteroidales bacterium]